METAPNDLLHDPEFIQDVDSFLMEVIRLGLAENPHRTIEEILAPMLQELGEMTFQAHCNELADGKPVLTSAHPRN